MKISNSGGITFSEVLQVTFIVLKLCKIINWSWFWVLSPTWIGLILIIILIVLYIILK